MSVRHARTNLSVMPNAGLPMLGANGAEYPLTPEELAAALAGFVTEFGTRLVGGCCVEPAAWQPGGAQPRRRTREAISSATPAGTV